MNLTPAYLLRLVAEFATLGIAAGVLIRWLTLLNT
jgi:hypothetical protein